MRASSVVIGRRESDHKPTPRDHNLGDSPEGKPAVRDLVIVVIGFSARACPEPDLADRLAALEAELGALRGRVERLEPKPRQTSRAEVALFARIAGLVVLDQEFEAGDLTDDPAEARRIGRLLGKVEKSGGLMGLTVESRVVHGRRRWVLRAGVDLGGFEPAPQPGQEEG